MDDILIYNRTLEDHVLHLTQVFQVLKQNKLFVKFKKCAFAQRKIDYLGHIILDEGVATDPSKTATMFQRPTPRNFTDLRGFLGLTGYYRKFVQNYGILAKPLTVLLQHKTFIWTDEAQTTFDALKKAMSSTPVLTLPDFELAFVIETDACEKGVGAMLSQNGHPITFFSKSLSANN
jgi:hypothetical protein